MKFAMQIAQIVARLETWRHPPDQARDGTLVNLTKQNFNGKLDYLIGALYSRSIDGFLQDANGNYLHIESNLSGITVYVTVGAPAVSDRVDYDERWTCSGKNRSGGMMISILRKEREPQDPGLANQWNREIVTQSGAGEYRHRIYTTQIEQHGKYANVDWALSHQTTININGRALGFEHQAGPLQDIALYLYIKNLNETASYLKEITPYVQSKRGLFAGKQYLIQPSRDGFGDWLFIREGTAPIPISKTSLGVWDECWYKAAERLEYTRFMGAGYYRKTIFLDERRCKRQFTQIELDSTGDGGNRKWLPRGFVFIRGNADAVAREVPYQSSMTVRPPKPIDFAEKYSEKLPVMVSA